MGANKFLLTNDVKLKNKMYVMAKQALTTKCRPDLILKLYILIILLTSYVPCEGQNGTMSRKCNGKDNEFDLNFEG